MDTVSEDFLDSWINLSTILRNKRYMVNLSFNEGVLCHILYKELTDRNNKRGLSVKEICNRTSLLKSQINKIINGLVDKGLVKRTKSKEDKRVIYISLNEDKIDIYKEEMLPARIIVDMTDVMNDLYDKYNKSTNVNDFTIKLSYTGFNQVEKIEVPQEVQQVCGQAG